MSRTRLDTVVRVRELEERIARGAVGVARATVVQRREERDGAAARVDELVADQPASALAFIERRRVLARAGQLVTEADLAIRVAHDGVDQTLVGWKSAARRLDGVERLEERLAAATRVEQGRREAAEVDDLSTTRWRRGNGRPKRRLDGTT